MSGSNKTSHLRRISWSQLGWKPSGPAFPAGHGFPAPGPATFLVIAPWCPDCQALLPDLASTKSVDSRPIWLVGEFAPADAVLDFRERAQVDWPVLLGQTEKSEVARQAAGFREIRQEFGDDRIWGLPLWIDAQVARDGLEVEAVRWT